MPITKSAKKALRSSENKRAHNLVLKNKLHKALKRVSKDNINETISLIDKTAKIHFITKNRAARLKSRLGKKFGTPKNVKAKNSNVKVATEKKKVETIKKPVAKTAVPLGTQKTSKTASKAKK